MRTYLLLAGTWIAVVVLLLSSGSALASRGSVANDVANFLGRPFTFLASFVQYREAAELVKTLSFENEALKAKLVALGKSPRPQIVDSQPQVFARVYSQYPFNTHGFVSINAGADQGVAAGDAVTIGGYIFIGQVARVYADHSTVRTIFDPSWKLPVKVREDVVDGLLVGGRTPLVTLIANEHEVERGDAIYTASREFLFGLTVGTVHTLTNDPGQAFQEATLSVPYKLSDVQEVTVIL
ncbi:MAG: hypothetical protein HY536_00015 [Candidatus Colwellbacteria bacterium]|nr:hypothetical protein [Candidatus Colwellbacteria bacterium]